MQSSGSFHLAIWKKHLLPIGSIKNQSQKKFSSKMSATLQSEKFPLSLPLQTTTKWTFIDQWRMPSQHLRMPERLMLHYIRG